MPRSSARTKRASGSSSARGAVVKNGRSRLRPGAQGREEAVVGDPRDDGSLGPAVHDLVEPDGFRLTLLADPEAPALERDQEPLLATGRLHPELSLPDEDAEVVRPGLRGLVVPPVTRPLFRHVERARSIVLLRHVPRRAVVRLHRAPVLASEPEEVEVEVGLIDPEPVFASRLEGVPFAAPDEEEPLPFRHEDDPVAGRGDERPREIARVRDARPILPGNLRKRVARRVGQKRPEDEVGDPGRPRVLARDVRQDHDADSASEIGREGGREAEHPARVAQKGPLLVAEDEEAVSV